jgi:hypothetical protein
MQATKDSFYVALRDRLVVVNPNRTVTLDGVIRPAIAVVENEPPTGAPPLYDTYYLSWGETQAAKLGAGSLMELQCTIAYCTQGSAEIANLDRGRELAALDSDLLAICSPPKTAKYDYSSGSAVPLGTAIFWTQPMLGISPSQKAMERSAKGGHIGREAHLKVFFYPEVSGS